MAWADYVQASQIKEKKKSVKTKKKNKNININKNIVPQITT